MYLDKTSDEPLYIQLYKFYKNKIENNELKEGDKLPSIRSLSKKLEINNITVVNAYKLLENENYITSERGSGTYVGKNLFSFPQPLLNEGSFELMSDGVLPLNKNNINFSSISPSPEIFPVKEFTKALMEILKRDKGYAFAYPEILGYQPLRESISKFLMDNYNFQVDYNFIQIVSGGQQGLDIISKTLIDHGDYIFAENPTYPGAMATFKSRGAKVIGIPILEDGVDLEKLESYIKRFKPKFFYMMTNFQSPTTYSYSEEKKQGILNLSKKYGFYIIEDDFLSDLYFDNKKRLPLKALDEIDQVIYIKSFSKIFMPGVRIGFMTVPKALFKDIVKAKHTTDISSSGFLQRAFDYYLRENYWKKYIERLKDIYNEKYKLMIDKLENFKKYNISYSLPNGGLSLWIKLPETIDSLELYKEAEESNLSLVPGKIFFINDTIYSNYIRLSFGYLANNEIIKGMEVLDRLFSKRLESEENKYMPLI